MLGGTGEFEGVSRGCRYSTRYQAEFLVVFEALDREAERQKTQAQEREQREREKREQRERVAASERNKKAMEAQRAANTSDAQRRVEEARARLGCSHGRHISL